MLVVVAPFLICCVVLALAGLAKLRDPRFTAGALRSLGVPAGPATVRAIGAGELLLAVVAGASGWWLAAWLVAFSYVVFAAIVLAARHAGTAIQTCGCFGVPDVPPTRTHIALNVVLGAVAAIAGAIDVVSPISLLADEPAGAIVLLALAGLGGWLAQAVFRDLAIVDGVIATARAR